MKIFIPILFIFFSLSTYAASVMKPGLWDIEMMMGGPGGKQVDPMAEMRKAMAGMSPEQQKQMAGMMGKMGGIGMGAGKAMQMCYTKEMLEDEANLNQQQGKKCTSTIKEKSANKIVADYKCEDGTAGTTVFKIKDSTHYTGDVDFTDKSGQKSKMTLKGTFASSDCGDVKPLRPAATASAANAKPAMPVDPDKAKTAKP